MKKTPPIADQMSSLPRQRRGHLARYLIVAVGCVLIVDALVGDRGLLAIVKANQEYRALDFALGHARAENARLREQARQLREDPAAVEAIARRELGLIRPGERLFIVKDINPRIPDPRSPVPDP